MNLRLSQIGEWLGRLDTSLSTTHKMKHTKGGYYHRRIDKSTWWTKVKCFFGYHKKVTHMVNIYRTTYHCKYCYTNLGETR